MPNKCLHRALAELEFPIGNINCFICKDRTPYLPLAGSLQLSTLNFTFLLSRMGTDSITKEPAQPAVRLSKQQGFFNLFTKK